MLPRFSSLGQYAAVRDAVLARITAVLEADRRVAAAWLSGSFGRGEADAWADLDLHLAVSDEHLDAFLAERYLLYDRVGRPVLVQASVPGNAQPGSTFQLVLYPGPVEVDWNIGPLGQAVRPLGYRMLVERVHVPVVTPPPLDAMAWQEQAARWLTFFWAMAPIAVKYAGRGQTYRAVSQIALLSQAYIALWRLLHDPASPEPLLHWTNRLLEPELDAALPQLGPEIDPMSALVVVERLCAAVEQLHPGLEACNVAVPAAMPGQAGRLAALAHDILRQGPPPRRKYR
jgi:predicted nucleotidyltransferase